MCNSRDTIEANLVKVIVFKNLLEVTNPLPLLNYDVCRKAASLELLWAIPNGSEKAEIQC